MPHKSDISGDYDMGRNYVMEMMRMKINRRLIVAGSAITDTVSYLKDYQLGPINNYKATIQYGPVKKCRKGKYKKY